METAVISLICIALILVGGMTMSQGFMTSVDTTSAVLEELGERDEAILRTEVSPQTANISGGGTTLVVALENSGQIKLADFEKWDVIVQYYDDGGSYYVEWLAYSDNATPGDNEWVREGIYIDADSETLEVYETDILNPGEEIKIQAQLNPAVGADTTNLLVVSTPNGVPASITFSP